MQRKNVVIDSEAIQPENWSNFVEFARTLSSERYPAIRVLADTGRCPYPQQLVVELNSARGNRDTDPQKFGAFLLRAYPRTLPSTQ